MNIRQIKETCIYIEDLSLAKKFYNELLGLPVISEVEGKHIFFRAGTSVLLCFNPENSKFKDSPPPHYTYGPQHFAFEVSKEDYMSTKKRMSALRIEIIDEVHWPSGQKSFYFKDPAGNVLEIVPEGIWE